MTITNQLQKAHLHDYNLFRGVDVFEVLPTIEYLSYPVFLNQNFDKMFNDPYFVTTKIIPNVSSLAFYMLLPPPSIWSISFYNKLQGHQNLRVSSTIRYNI